jgi:hypothetical protein
MYVHYLCFRNFWVQGKDRYFSFSFLAFLLFLIFSPSSHNNFPLSHFPLVCFRFELFCFVYSKYFIQIIFCTFLCSFLPLHVSLLLILLLPPLSSTFSNLASYCILFILVSYLLVSNVLIPIIPIRTFEPIHMMIFFDHSFETRKFQAEVINYL